MIRPSPRTLRPGLLLPLFALLLAALIVGGLVLRESRALERLPRPATARVAPIGEALPCLVALSAMYGLPKAGDRNVTADLGRVVGPDESKMGHWIRPITFEDQPLPLHLQPGSFIRCRLMATSPEAEPGSTPVGAVVAGDLIVVADDGHVAVRVALVATVSITGEARALEVVWEREAGPPVLVTRPLQTLPCHPVPLAASQLYATLPGTYFPTLPAATLSVPAPSNRFVIMSFADLRLAPLQRLTWATVAAYAARHGYTARQLAPASNVRTPIHFAKYSEALKLLDEGFEWLVWMDADVAVTNPAVRLEAIIERFGQPSTSLIIARDPWTDQKALPVNSGVFLLRASDWSRRLLHAVSTVASLHASGFVAFPRSRRFDLGGLVDQPVLTQLLLLEDQLSATPTDFDVFYRAEYHPHVTIVPARVMNSAQRAEGYHDHPDAKWHPGDWLVHVTGEKDLRKRMSALRGVLAASVQRAAPYPTTSASIPIPLEVEAVVHAHEKLLLASTLSLRQAQLIGAAIHAHGVSSPPRVLVWSGAAPTPHAALWGRLAREGAVTVLVDGRYATAASSQENWKVQPVESINPPNKEAEDIDLIQATLLSCCRVCVAARRRLTLALPRELCQAWDVIIIDDPQPTPCTNHMVYTAALLATTPRGHATDVFLLNAEHRMPRRYADAFLGPSNLQNVYACPSPEDPNCRGSLLMHWRIQTEQPATPGAPAPPASPAGSDLSSALAELWQAYNYLAITREQRLRRSALYRM